MQSSITVQLEMVKNVLYCRMENTAWLLNGGQIFFDVIPNLSAMSLLLLRQIVFSFYPALCVNPPNSHFTKLISQFYVPEVLLLSRWIGWAVIHECWQPVTKGFVHSHWHSKQQSCVWNSLPQKSFREEEMQLCVASSHETVGCEEVLRPSAGEAPPTSPLIAPSSHTV